jgi:hypothetical protein
MNEKRSVPLVVVAVAAPVIATAAATPARIILPTPAPFAHRRSVPARSAMHRSRYRRHSLRSASPVQHRRGRRRRAQPDRCSRCRRTGSSGSRRVAVPRHCRSPRLPRLAAAADELRPPAGDSGWLLLSRKRDHARVDGGNAPSGAEHSRARPRVRRAYSGLVLALNAWPRMMTTTQTAACCSSERPDRSICGVTWLLEGIHCDVGRFWRAAQPDFRGFHQLRRFDVLRARSL